MPSTYKNVDHKGFGKISKLSPRKGPAPPNNLAATGLTIVHPFYNDHDRFDLQFSNWLRLSSMARDIVRVVLIDDHSTPPLVSSVTRSRLKRINFRLSIYRIVDDLKWNTPGALNLGVHVAETPWVIIVDSDCLLSPLMMDRLLTRLPLDRKAVYFFNRRRMSTNASLVDHTRFLPCTMLFHKDSFWDIGGFDENFTGERSGGYGYFDNDFATRILRSGYNRAIVHGILVCEYMDDIVGPGVQVIRGDKVERTNLNINKKLFRDKLTGKDPMPPRVMAFDWRKDFEHDLCS